MNTRKIYPQWFLIAPITLYVLFCLLPGLLGVLLSFTDWTVRSAGNIHFVGLQNFIDIFTCSNVHYAQGIVNTLKFTIISNIVKLIPALLLAVMLSGNLRGRNLYRTVLYMPSILPFLIIGLVFNAILSYNGLLNNSFAQLGLENWQQKWLSDPNIVWVSIFGVDAWRGIGYVMTIFLAGINAIPHSYYEAAEIDGANFWQKLRHITNAAIALIMTPTKELAPAYSKLLKKPCTSLPFSIAWEKFSKCHTVGSIIFMRADSPLVLNALTSTR